jgi:hypothetical protein
MTESSVCPANLFIQERKIRVQFDSPLKQRERCLWVASLKELSSLGARLQCLQGGAGRYFERLIEPRQRFGGSPSFLRRRAAVAPNSWTT